MKQTIQTLIPLCFAAILAGCGGGGGSTPAPVIIPPPPTFVCNDGSRIPEGDVCMQTCGDGTRLLETESCGFRTEEYGANYGLQNINARAAYEAGAFGQGVTVGVMDTGVESLHRDLNGNIVGGGGALLVAVVYPLMTTRADTARRWRALSELGDSTAECTVSLRPSALCRCESAMQTAISPAIVPPS